MVRVQAKAAAMSPELHAGLIVAGQLTMLAVGVRWGYRIACRQLEKAAQEFIKQQWTELRAQLRKAGANEKADPAKDHGTRPHN